MGSICTHQVLLILTGQTANLDGTFSSENSVTLDTPIDFEIANNCHYSKDIIYGIDCIHSRN